MLLAGAPAKPGSSRWFWPRFTLVVISIILAIATIVLFAVHASVIFASGATLSQVSARSWIITGIVFAVLALLAALVSLAVVVSGDQGALTGVLGFEAVVAWVAALMALAGSDLVMNATALTIALSAVAAAYAVYVVIILFATIQRRTG